MKLNASKLKRADLHQYQRITKESGKNPEGILSQKKGKIRFLEGIWLNNPTRENHTRKLD